MLIDVNCFAGRWPFVSGLPEHPEEIAQTLGDVGITRAYVSSCQSALVPDPTVEEWLLQEQIKDIDLFAWSPIIRPNLPHWGSVLQGYADAGVQLVKLLPSFHEYHADDDVVVELINRATALGIRVAIILRMEDERRQHPLCRPTTPSTEQVEQLANKAADTPLLILNAMKAEVMRLGQLPNLYFDIAFYEYTTPIPDAVNDAAADRILFGSCAPIQYAKAAQMKMDLSVASDEQRDAVAYENVQRFLSTAR